MNDAKNLVPISEMMPLIRRAIDSHGEVTLTVTGISMQPMLYNRRDHVTIKKVTKSLKKYDIPFYEDADGRFLLHRIIKVKRDNSYICRGDNRWNKEYIHGDQIIGVVKSFVRNGKYVEVDKSFLYWVYTHTWSFFHHFKKYYSVFSKIKQKISGRVFHSPSNRNT